MRKPATSLTAGTLIAIPLLALSCGAATSQTVAVPPASAVTSNQISLGNLFGDQTLNVVTASEAMIATTTATGNSHVTGIEVDGHLAVSQTQTVGGSVKAHTVVNAKANPGSVVTMTTTAIGNTGDARADVGAMDGVYAQTAQAMSITADSHFEGPNVYAQTLSSTSQAVANSQGVTLVEGATGGSDITQTSAALVQADGGGVVGASDSATFTAMAAGNNVTASAIDGSNQTVRASQTQTGQRVQASQFMAMGEAQSATVATVASANNLVAQNEEGQLDVRATQNNSSYVQSQAVGTAWSFGDGSANAYGVGNSVLVGNIGQLMSVSNDQTNSGAGVLATASFTGADGYDAYASATAMGNAATGFACSTCNGSIGAVSQQRNTADIGATVTAGITGSARSITGTSNAVGNSASFYVSRPSN